jgi:phosphonate transport system substrate-binding protein
MMPAVSLRWMNLMLLRFCLFACLALPVHADITVGLLTSRANEQTLEDWQPIFNDLATATGQQIKGWVTNDRAALLAKLQNNEIQVARVDNKLALDAVEKAKCNVFASLVQTGNSTTYRSLMLVRKDSPIQNIAQLLNLPKKLRYASGNPDSTAEFLIPQYHLFLKNNVLPEQYFKQITPGSAEQAFVALAKNQVDVAVSNSFDIEQLKEKYPRDFSQMRVVWQSPAFAFDPLSRRRDVATPLKNKVSQFFLSYGRKGGSFPQAKQHLYYADQLEGFIAADNRSLRQITDLQLFHDLFRLNVNMQIDPAAKASKEKAYYTRYNDLANLLGGAK